MHDRPLYDITPFSALDYPDHLASIFWFAGCNMRCSYCYNRDIVLGEGSISEAEALSFLKRRKGMLEAVVLSGGEATRYAPLPTLCETIKQMGFKIKLDTNGLNPDMVKILVENGLIDTIALDYKAPKEKYQSITKNRHFDRFSETLNYLIAQDFSFEVRTTVHSDLLGAGEINRIMQDLKRRGYRGTYFLQSFVYTEQTLGKVKPEKRLFEENELKDTLNVVWRK